MGCEGLLVEPWALKNEEMVQEFLLARSNEWEGTIRRDPKRWIPGQKCTASGRRVEEWRKERTS